MSVFSRRKGFTLIELLAAAGLTAAMAAVVIALAGAMMRAWNRAADSAEMDRTAALALDYIQADLEGAVFLADGNVWLLADVSGNPLLPGQKNTWLRFITASAAGGRNTSAPAAVSYSLQYADPSGGGRMWALYRAVVDPGKTYADFTGRGDAGLAKLAAKQESDFLGPEHNGAANSHAEALLAPGAVSFSITFYVRRGGELSPVPSGSVQVPFAEPPLFPARADVSLTLLSDEGQSQLEAVAAGEIPDSQKERILRARATAYTRRIHFFCQLP